jgi:hypothetical protein
MPTFARNVLRMIVCGAGGAVAGALAVALAHAAWVLIVPAVVVGIVSWLGFELGHTWKETQQQSWRRTGIPLLVAVVSALALFCGVAFGFASWLASAPARFGGAQILQISILGTAAVGLALTSGFIVRRASGSRPLLGGLIAVGLGPLCGVAFAIGFGLVFALTYRVPCGPHQYCLISGPWLGLQLGLILGPAIGLWLGIAIWLALGLGLTLVPIRPHKD